MDLGLTGRKAIVTGAAMGIGRATALSLATEGCVVAVLDIAKEPLQQLEAEADSGTIVPLHVDFSNGPKTTDGVDTAIRELGGLDILVNNVGAGAVRDFDDLTEDDWRRTLDLNFLSYVNASRASLPALRDAEAPCIVNNTSDLGRQPEAMPADYSASKAAVLALTKSLARAEGPKIRVNAVAPGPIWSPFWTKPGGFADTLAKVHGMEAEAAVEHEMKLRQLPLQRLGKPEEVASVITFLASDACSYVTGSVWGVDGGSIRSLI